MDLGAVRCASRSATPFPVPLCLNVVAVITVEKLFCMVFRIDYRGFSEIVLAHVSGIVFSTMVLAHGHHGFFGLIGTGARDGTDAKERESMSPSSPDPHLTLTLSPPIRWERRGNSSRTV
jgi:hypothetical protein